MNYEYYVLEDTENVELQEDITIFRAENTITITENPYIGKQVIRHDNIEDALLGFEQNIGFFIRKGYRVIRSQQWAAVEYPKCYSCGERHTPCGEH